MKFTDSELDSAYIASTDVLNLINKTYKKQADAKDFSNEVKKLKEQKDSNEEEDDVGISIDDGREKNIGSKIHREKRRNIYNILNIKKESRGIELKKVIVNIVIDLKKALKKNSLDEEMYVYKAVSDELNLKGFEVFSLNEEDELKSYLRENKLKRKNNLYRIKLPKDTNFIAFSNIIFYDNKNMTLPVGMNESNKILVDLSYMELNETKNKTIGKAYLENDGDDFSRLIIKPINVHEYEM